MHRLVALGLLAFSPFFVACSSEDSKPGGSSTSGSGSSGAGDSSGATGSGGSKSHGAGSTSASGTSAGSGGSSGSGSAAGGGGDGGSAAGPDDLTLTMGAFEVPAGAEVLMCQYFPPDGKDRWTNELSSVESTGIHHLLVYRIVDDGKGGYGPIDCTNSTIPPNVGQLPAAKNSTFRTPPGVAFSFTKQYGLYFQSHFINTTSAALHPTVTWTAKTVEASQVQNTAGTLFYINKNIDIPPEKEMKITKQCNAPADLKLFSSGAHYHLHTVDYLATIAGNPVLHLDGTSEVLGKVYDPPFTIHENDLIQWTCTDNNTSAVPLTFGPSLTNNEMCQFVGFVYPVADSDTYSCPPGANQINSD